MAAWVATASLTALLPMLAFTVYFVHGQIEGEHVRRLEALQRRTLRAAAAIAQDLDAVEATARALRELPPAVGYDLGAIHGVAARIAGADPRIEAISLSDAGGSLRMSTRRPWGEPLPTSQNEPVYRPIFSGSDRLLSPLITGTVSQRAVVVLATPFQLRNDELLALRITIRLDAIERRLHEQTWPREWSVGLVDQHLAFVATAAPADQVSLPSTPSMLRALDEGLPLTTGALRDGRAVALSVARVPGTDWHVVAAIPRELLQSEVRRSMLAILVASVLCSLLAAASALLLARALGRQLRRLADQTTPSGAPRDPAAGVGILEIDRLAGELDASRAATRHVDAQLQAAREEVMTRLTERSELLDVLAHEVRQPLNNASAALQAAERALSGRVEPAVAAPLQRAQLVLSDVQASIGNTLAAASLLLHGEAIRRDDTDIDALIGLALADLPAHERGRVRIDRRTRTRTAQMDSNLMRLALRNLLSNALRYSPAGTPVILRIDDSDEPLALLIDVIDAGSGIDPATLRHAIDPERSRHRVRGAARHVLGLYIVRRVMDLHHGRLDLLHSGPDGSALRMVLVQGADD